MDTEIESVVAQVDTPWGAAHSADVAHTPTQQAARDTAVAAGLLVEQAPGLLVVSGRDERVVTARRFRGHLTCASAAEALGYPMRCRPTRVHIAVGHNHRVRTSGACPTDRVRIHRGAELTPLTMDGFPVVAPAEVVADRLTCLDEDDAVAVADAALNRGQATRAGIADLLTSRYAASARARLASAEEGSRSLAGGQAAPVPTSNRSSGRVRGGHA